MSADVPDLRGGSIKFWLPILLSMLWSGTTVVWFAAKYPDRTEHNDVVLRLNRLEIEMVRISTSAESSRASSERVEVKQQRFEDKLDAIGQQVRRGR